MTPRRSRWLYLWAALSALTLAAPEVRAVGVGATCGGIVGVQCDAGLWCQLPDGRCGVADLQGVCAKSGTVCTMQYQPVCGCDGKTYGNSCHLRVSHAQKRSDGACR